MMTAGAALTNSRRRFEKLAYTPLTLTPPSDNEPRDALGTAALVRMLTISDAELAQLDRSVQDHAQRQALSAIKDLRTAISGSAALAAAAALGSAPTAALLGVGDALLAIRSRARDTIADALRDLEAAYGRAQVGVRSTGSGNVEAGAAPVEEHAPPARHQPRGAHVSREANCNLRPRSPGSPGRRCLHLRSRRPFSAPQEFRPRSQPRRSSRA